MPDYYECDCGCTILRVEYNKKDGEFYFSIYDGHKGKMPWSQRLRHGVRIAMSGEPYGDQIIFNKKDAEQLAKDIISKLLSKGSEKK